PETSNVTILYSDVTRSSAFFDHYPDLKVSKELVKRIQLLFEQIIPKHGGKVAQISGDGVFAFFGYPEPREDDVLRAVEAAIDLREASHRIGEEEPWRALPPKLHTGIHSGE